MRARPNAALALAVLAALGACAFVEPQPPIGKSVEAGAGPPQELVAGAARVALTPVQRPVPLAGFGPSPIFVSDVNRTKAGEPLDLFARALSIRGTEELDRDVDRVVLVSVDALIVTAAFRALVKADLVSLAKGLPEIDARRTQLVIAATHTHAGIGGFWPGTLPEWASIGPYDPQTTRETAKRTAQAILAAIRSERPARFANGTTQLPEYVSCRAAHKDLTDPELLALALDGEKGDPIARVVVFASHPTELYGTEHLSPAWPGACCEELERRASGAVALVFQGGLGDQKPAFPGSIFDGFQEGWTEGKVGRSRAYGQAIGRAAARALEDRPRSPRSVLRLARAPLALPFPALGACPIPILDRILAIPVALPYWPDKTTVEVLRVGDVALALAPFELCAETTIRTKARLRRAGFHDAAVVSLANDWLGYAPDGIPWPWTTSGLTSFGGTGMGYVVGDRLCEAAERIAPAAR